MSNSTNVKRMSLMLDEQLLREEVHALGVTSYSAAVNLALAEAVCTKKVQGLREAFGQNLWEGNLSTMRDDRPHRRAGARARPARKRS